MLVLVALATGCAGGGADDPPLGTTAAVTAPVTPEVPSAPSAGTGVVVVGGGSSSFDVTSCRLEADPDEPPGARTLLAVDGRGRTAAGVEFTVEVQRFATDVKGVVTYSDTIAYTDPARILQAQRIEVGGAVTDLRDPDATSPLLRPRADGVSGAGRAGAPGGLAEDEGTVGLALNVTC